MANFSQVVRREHFRYGKLVTHSRMFTAVKVCNVYNYNKDVVDNSTAFNASDNQMVMSYRGTHIHNNEDSTLQVKNS